MEENDTVARVSEIPPCDMCGKPAEYDAATRVGAWAYLCPAHYSEYGIGLGLGRGQRLVLRNR